MKERLFSLFTQLESYRGEQQVHENEVDLLERLITVALILGAISSLASRMLILFEPFSTAIVDSIILLVYIFFYRAVMHIKDAAIRRVLALVVYCSLLVYACVAFYQYIGPAIWIFVAIFYSMALINSSKDMLYGYFATTFVLLIYVGRFEEAFTTDVVFGVGLWITLIILSFIMYGLHSIINGRYAFMKSQYDKILQTENQYFFTLNSIGDGVITTDAEGRIKYMNPIAEKLTGYSLEEVFGQRFGDKIKMVDEVTREPFTDFMDHIISQNQTILLSNHTVLVSKELNEYVIESTASPIQDEHGTLQGVVMIFRDHSFKKEKQREIEYLSYHDQLTGLYNRRFFEEEIKRIDLETRLPLAIMFIDVNGLKVINDAFGHQVGDQLIQKVAKVLTSYKRNADVIARIGGDEFIIVMPKTDHLFLNHFTKQVNDALKAQEVMGIEVSISFGWDIKSNSEVDIFDCVKNAEDKMYQSKIFYSASKRSDIIKSISSALSIKSDREEQHGMRVGHLCYAMGRSLGFSEKECQTLKISGELHDIGKISIDEALLNKAEPLSPDEWDDIKQHSETGYRLLNTSKEFYTVAEYVRDHHERWDGQGYPSGLSGLDIPLYARIITLADAYDAMTNFRTYDSLKTKDEAVQELLDCAGKQFDPELTRVFINHVLKVNSEEI